MHPVMPPFPGVLSFPMVVVTPILSIDRKQREEQSQTTK